MGPLRGNARSSNAESVPRESSLVSLQGPNLACSLEEYANRLSPGLAMQTWPVAAAVVGSIEVTEATPNKYSKFLRLTIVMR